MPVKITLVGRKRSRGCNDKEDTFPSPKRRRLNADQATMPCTVPIITPIQPQLPLVLRPNATNFHSRPKRQQFLLEPHPSLKNRNVISLISETDSTKRSEMQYRCDKKGYIQFKKGLTIANKYKTLKQLGKGTFSRVFECEYNGHHYALKIIRNSYKYQCAAATELSILRRIRDNDAENESHCIHIIESANYRGHPVFVFPLLSQSIYQFMSCNDQKPFCYDDVIDIMWQICSAVAYMHSLGIINTDLKPENMVLVNADIDTSNANWFTFSSPKSTAIKLIDFGSAVIANQRLYSHLIQTRHYRAPEVVFKLDWTFAADIWSIGCILVELVDGKMLFNTHCSIDHLNQMVKCIGAPPLGVLQSMDDETWDEYFNANGSLNMMRATVSRIQCNKLKHYFKPKKCSKQGAELFNLCRKMLRWDPKKRITAEQALKHAVFKKYD